ncbi:calcium homeostasis modulator protein 5 isoform X2 [Octodon degus]|uniref:Calcium homeostasis modulator protein 5 isoform X2 n=1 Tax=Octodon degus TaxID=10160 RepID=A0A6P3FM73_OCTDE|nr:calcium homeostasis modulator protein 5 isoform X2 [Octodon degus]
MDKFKAVLDLHLKHRSTLGYGVVTLLTAGGERLFSAVVFQCPCSEAWNLPYGLVFLLVPALALFLLGYALSARTWRLLTGCCARTRGCAGLRGMVVCVQLSAAAALAPLTWVAVALLGGSFYECAASGSTALGSRLCRGRDPVCAQQLPRVPCGQAKPPEVQDLLKDLKAQSQILGWFLICSASFFSLLTTCYARCRSKVSYLQLSFWKTYAQKEQEHLENTFVDYANMLSERNLKSFFENKRPDVFPMPTFAAWEAASELHCFHPSQQHYSTLHRVVDDGLVPCPQDAETTRILVGTAQDL